MDALAIMGGTRLAGTVAVSGSKNAALPIMAAAILADGPVVLDGVPELVDVDTLALLLGYLGLEVKREADRALRIETVDPRRTRAGYELVSRMRASFCVLGPLLARRGRAVVSLPGGCKIGARPVDLHLAGLAALGADLRIRHGYVLAEARRLRGAEIDLVGPRGPTVTGTANVMSAATLARGRTVLRGAAAEPEIVDLGRFLIAAGARISGLGSDVIEIEGVEQLGGAAHRVIGDRIEAATLLVAAAITRGSATVVGARAEHLGAVVEALRASGAEVACRADAIEVRGGERPRAVELAARPYPGLPTDVQAQMMALLALADGRSTVSDEVFPERFLHVAELNRLGANVARQSGRATVDGVPSLSGAEVQACDLRASAALVLAGLAARGTTVVHDVQHLDRGYERLEVKLSTLGARIDRVAASRNGMRNVAGGEEVGTAR